MYDPLPVAPDLRQLTSVQLVRLYSRLWDRLAYRSGTSGAWDEPTLRLCYPGYFRAIMSCRCEAVRRLHS